MARRRVADPYKRQRTRQRGISFRERADGSRTYYVYADGRHLRIDGGEREALLVQADLRGKQARGLRVTPLETSFGELAEEWFGARAPGWTRKGYRISLDSHLLPVFGTLQLEAITPDHIARFIAERRAAGASEAYIAANLRPLNGVCELAVRRGLISTNPVTALLPEERPKPARRKRRTWTPEEIKRLLAAARELGTRPGNIYDYTPIITVAIYTGMRLGELLGLRWQDVDLREAVIHVRQQLCRDTRTLVPPKTDAVAKRPAIAITPIAEPEPSATMSARCRLRRAGWRGRSGPDRTTSWAQRRTLPQRIVRAGLESRRLHTKAPYVPLRGRRRRLDAQSFRAPHETYPDR